MRPTVETVEEEDDALPMAPLVNTPYIVEQLFPLSAAALSQNAASPVMAPVSVQTPTFESDIAAGKHCANDHSPDATPRTTLSPSPEPFRPPPPPYQNLSVNDAGAGSSQITLPVTADRQARDAPALVQATTPVDPLQGLPNISKSAHGTLDNCVHHPAYNSPTFTSSNVTLSIIHRDTISSLPQCATVNSDQLNSRYEYVGFKPSHKFIPDHILACKCEDVIPICLQLHEDSSALPSCQIAWLT
ncbi:hypothetical protein C8R44DRAFT_736299 [Mycena epipterygia]|nr:hypothetical protein C8R44DRAFT_736299 [Mycena epipterygia]